jgi:hypothetical protein
VVSRFSSGIEPEDVIIFCPFYPDNNIGLLALEGLTDLVANLTAEFSERLAKLGMTGAKNWGRVSDMPGHYRLAGQACITSRFHHKREIRLLLVH